MHRNLTHAFLDALRELNAQDTTVSPRGSATKELLSRVTRIESPYERVFLTPHRNNNIFAAIAETLWVLAGRNDLEYLTRYLPNAGAFSDDGTTWRAAYGPRLRNWNGVDQVKEVVNRFKEDPETRRAAMMIFDPAQDFIESKDIPCNNWIHVIQREGKLHMNVAIRSNDLVWGFSGINAFEWSYLHEMLAYWTGSEVGNATYIAGSLHLYERHFERAQQMLEAAKGKTLYSFGVSRARFATPFEQLDHVLREVLEIERSMGTRDTNIKERMAAIQDDLLRNSLEMLHVYNLHLNGAERAEILECIEALPENDFRIAAIEFFARKYKDKALFRMSERERAFFDYYWGEPEGTTLEGLYEVTRMLHYKKSLSYGDSWKKHGEVLGAFSNITRKFDRIEGLLSGAQATIDEGLLDTLADLSVYAAKYLTLMSEMYPDAFQTFLGQFPDAESIKEYRGVEGYNAVTRLLLGEYNRSEQPRTLKTLEDCMHRVRHTYAELEHILTGPSPQDEAAKKCEVAKDLSLAASHAVTLLSKEEPAAMSAFAGQVVRL